MSDIHKFQCEKRDLPNCPCSSWPFSPAIILNFTTASAPNSRNEHCIKTHLLHLKSFAVIRHELLHILFPPSPPWNVNQGSPTHQTRALTEQTCEPHRDSLSSLPSFPFSGHSHDQTVWPSGSLIYQSSSPLNSPPQLLLFPILIFLRRDCSNPSPTDEQSTLYPIPFCLFSFSPTSFCPPGSAHILLNYPSSTVKVNSVGPLSL